MKNFIDIKLLAVCLLSVFGVGSLFADIHRDDEEVKERILEDKAQREITGTYDVQYNTVSNLEFPTTNYGIFGYDVQNSIGGGVWPRGTPNQYIFGGGCWLGARKFPTERRAYRVFESREPDGVTIDTIFLVPDRDSMGKYCAVTYNPLNARSFMVPGNVIDGLGVDPNQRLKYRTYFSTDYDQNGRPFAGTDGPNWPVWDTSDDPEDTLKYSRYFGFYVDDVQARNTNTYPRGPAYISGEDIFATFKDTDLTAHDLGVAAAGLGYPLYLQTEITIYSWGFGLYQDFVFVKYNFVNVSEFRRDGLPADTLYDCFMAPIMDVDVARKPLSAAGAANDRVRYYGSAPGEDSTYNLAFQWSDGDRGEQGFGFGYLGFDFLESPATILRTEEVRRPIVDQNGDTTGFDVETRILERPENNMVRKDRPFYPNEEQLGLRTFQNWNIDEDRRTDEARYNFLSEGVLETDNGPGDKRFMMVTGPFNMRPGDSVRVVVGICLANTCSGGEATGEADDICELVAIDEFMQSVYDNNFRAPLPPDQSRMREENISGIDTIFDPDGQPIGTVEASRGLNNAAKIVWDNTSELSEDEEERGLDFLGYAIYRARRTDQDTFSLSQIVPGDQGLTSGASLQGWKEIQRYQLPFPFVKSTEYTVAGGDPSSFTFQDSIRIVGPYFNPETNELDQTKLTVMRFPTRSYQVPTSQQLVNNQKYIPQIFAMDSSRNPWFDIFHDMEGPEPFGSSVDPSDVINPDNTSDAQLEIMQDALLGVVDLKPSIVRFNPLYYNLVTKTVSQEEFESWPEDGFVYITELIDTIVYTRDVVTNEVDTTKIGIDCGDPQWVNDPLIGGRSGLDATDSCYLYVKDFYEVETPDLAFIADMNSFTPEVEIDSITETITYYDPALQRDVTVERLIRIEANPTGNFYVTVRYPKTEQEIANVMRFSNFERIQETLDTIYSALEQGSAAATLAFPDFSGSERVKEEVIVPYMTEITNDRTFIDIGDDDGDNQVELSSDVRRTEKIINQVPYYYRVLAYDEGHVNSGSERKLNSGQQVGSPNVVEIIPKPSAVGQRLSFDLIAADSTLLGSMNSFDLFAVDEDRAQQLFAGDTIQVRFTSQPSLTEVQYTNGQNVVEDRTYGLYSTNIQIENLTEDEPLYESNFFFEGRLGEFNNFNLPTENTFSLVLADTVIIETDVTTGDTVSRDDIGTPRSDAVIIKGGQFSTGNFRDQRSVYTGGWSQKGIGTLSFEFNYYLRQFGGIFRPDSTIEVVSDDPITTRIQPWDIEATSTIPNPAIINTTQQVGTEISNFGRATQTDANNEGQITRLDVIPATSPVYATFNNGPGTYRMILGEEQTMQVEFAYGQTYEETKTFNVPYHDVTMVNLTEYQRPTSARGDSTTVNMALPMEHIELPTNRTGEFATGPDDDEFGVPYPSPINLFEAGRDPEEFIGNFNITSYGWIDVRQQQINQIIAGRRFAILPENISTQDSSYSGFQGRYLKSATSVDGTTTIDFVNVINVAGAQFYTDYPNIGRFQPGRETLRRPIRNQYDTLDVGDFDPGAPNQFFYGFEQDGDRYIVNGLKRFGNDLGEGDELVLNIKGGVQGLPYDGATLTYVVRGGDPADDPTGPQSYTDGMMDGVNVVPNPYYITHQAQVSPYDARIHFTKLPPVCTIEIYTVTGELVREIQHDELSLEADRESVEVWDLLTDSGLRVQSQSLVARIYTPDGAETLKTFSLVVGSFRIVQD